MGTFSMCGRLAAQNFKKRRARERTQAKKRLQKAIERTYVDPVSGCIVTVLARGYAYGAEPRMKVVEEKVVDGHKVKVLPPGYAQGAYPAKNVSVRS